MDVPEKSIVILDFGSQYTQLIARCIRELNVYSIIVRFNTSAEILKSLNPSGIIFSGGPASVYGETAPTIDHEILNLNIPILGICYGLQLIVHILGGNVDSSSNREFGHAELSINETSPLLHKLGEKQNVWMSHSDKVLSIPPEFESIAETENTKHAAIANNDKKIYGIQFHPEVAHTPCGMDLLHNFVFSVCKCIENWSMSSFIETTVVNIQSKVKNDKVILGLSGGVDSSVTALLLQKAIGENLICVFVNNGLLRSGEPEYIKDVFGNRFLLNLHIEDATDRFLEKLKGVTEPESKRKIIGHKFIEVFDEVAGQYNNVRYLAQGTTYPDVIESVSINDNPSAVIKSHHNVGGLPEEMELDLIEPLRTLFKDEVREVGRQLGLPKELNLRQPFPGPGLAVRIIGEVEKEGLDVLRKADKVVHDEMIKAEFYYKVWQSFAVLLPVRSVGVMGDERTYENAIALRIVESSDGMTADWARLPYELLSKISNRIINEVHGINRVCYDISSKPPGTIEWE